MDNAGNVVNAYTYKPFGEDFANTCIETQPNPFKFTGQYFDSEINQYCLRARQYDPQLMRFSTRDPVKGKFAEPLTLHKYLYCGSDSINKIDLNGRFAAVLGGSLSFNSGEAVSAVNHNMSMVKSSFGGIMGKAAAAGVGVITHNAYIELAIGEAEGHVTGGTVGMGAVIGWSRDEGYFGGVIAWAAGGIGLGMNLTGTIDLAFSPNAQNTSDLTGKFMEVGGSVSTPYGTIAGSISRGVGNDIYLITVSYGIGLGSTSVEMHGFIGNTWLLEEW